MKKSIYFSGITLVNLMMLGCMFKIFHWPGASVLLTVSLTCFSFLFLPAALLSDYHSRQLKKYKWLYVATFITFSMSMMGMLLKVQHWPGAQLFLLLSLPLPFILFLPVYLYQTGNEKKDGDRNFLGVMFGLIFLAVFSVLLAFR